MTEFDCVQYYLALCITFDKFEAPVGIECRSNVEAIFGAVVP